MRKSIIFLTIVGLIALFSSCKKDETKAVLSATPTLPAITTVPGLTLQRAHGSDTVVFVGTPAVPGFAASINYYLEADTAGNLFQSPVVLASGTQDAIYKFSASDLNGILITKFPTDTVSSVEFRIRAVLIDDAVSVSVPLVYVSATSTASVTTYGLPRLDLINSGIAQKIQSPLGDGNYVGYVKLDPAKSFTLKDPDANIVYGDNAGALGVNGAAFTPSASGWFKLNANTVAHTYKLAPYNVGIIGSATPNVWNSPDTKLQWDIKQGCWYVSMDLELHLDGTMKCEYKFRLNDDWGWNIGGSVDNLTQGASNLVATPGHYLIRLFINPDGLTGHCTLTPN
jgi:hypothetical protein